jgi:hypothetical protein
LVQKGKVLCGPGVILKLYFIDPSNLFENLPIFPTAIIRVRPRERAKASPFIKEGHLSVYPVPKGKAVRAVFRGCQNKAAQKEKAWIQIDLPPTFVAIAFFDFVGVELDFGDFIR